MNPRNPSPHETHEHEPQSEGVYSAGTIIDMLLEAKLPSEEIVWIRDVLSGGLPPADMYNSLLDSKRTYGDVNTEVVRLINDALAILQQEHSENTQNTLQVLNSYIESRPNLFIVNPIEHTPLVALDATWIGHDPLLYAITPQGRVEHAATQLHIDTAYLRHDEKIAFELYKKQYEL